MNLKERATLVAKTFKVSVMRDKAAIVTEAYRKVHPYDWEKALGRAPRLKMRFEDTPCYKELVSLGLYDSKELAKEEADEIFGIAKNRFWKAVCGNVMVLALEADDWLKIDWAYILSNKAIRCINGEDKFEFASKYCG